MHRVLPASATSLINLRNNLFHVCLLTHSHNTSFPSATPFPCRLTVQPKLSSCVVHLKSFTISQIS